MRSRWLLTLRAGRGWLGPAALALTLAAFAACGGNNDDGTVTPGPTGTAAVATATSQARATATARAEGTSQPPAATSTAGSPSATSTSGATGTATPTSPSSTPSATSTPRPTPTPVVSNAVAAAGNDLDTRRGNFIGLNGSGSTDPDGDTLTYRWTQVHGPDVTGGAGIFVGPTPSFQVPLQVCTLIFELTVSDGRGNSLPDRVQINVFEHIGNPGLFVDGNSGSDETGDGTRERPFASIGFAINRINGPEQDIHVMSLEGGAAYEEPETLSPAVTASLYGGYGPGWVRDVEDNKTRVNGPATAVRFHVVDEDAWLSGFEITGANADSPGQDTFAVRSDGGGATFFVEDNVLRAGNAGDGTASINAGSSYGLYLGNLFNVEVKRNQVFAGNGGNGAAGRPGADGAAASSNGGNGSGGNGGSAGKGGTSSINGGGGGKGGSGLIPVDGAGGGKGGGGNGGAGGIGDKVGEGRVGDGSGGGGGAGGNGGNGGAGNGDFNMEGLFVPGNGENGANAGNGGGGGGGGGGAGGVGLTGGGGGGGGGAGVGGKGGTGGTGGGASIGIMLHKLVSVTIENNTVVAANGGNGGNGAAGGTGGNGTKGGVGAPNECSFLGCNAGRSGDGGEGGGGGAGGIGGQGGGGAGGPSLGIVIGADTSASIVDNSVSAGNGGPGGVGGAAGLGGSPGGNGGSTGGSGGCCAFLLETAGGPGSGGDGGWSYAAYDIDPDDSSKAVLTRNEMTAGNPGQGRAINGTAGSAGESNLGE